MYLVLNNPRIIKIHVAYDKRSERAFRNDLAPLAQGLPWVGRLLLGGPLDGSRMWSSGEQPEVEEEDTLKAKTHDFLETSYLSTIVFETSDLTNMISESSHYKVLVYSSEHMVISKTSDGKLISMI